MIEIVSSMCWVLPIHTSVVVIQTHGARGDATDGIGHVLCLDEAELGLISLGYLRERLPFLWREAGLAAVAPDAAVIV